MEFRKWLEIFGQGIEPPVQDPNKLNNGAFKRYEVPEEPDLTLQKPKKSKKPPKSYGLGAAKMKTPPQGEEQLPQF